MRMISILFLLSVFSPFVVCLESIAGYEPTTQVTDANAMDLDAEELLEQLDDEDTVGIAKSIYEQGGHSQSFALITLSSPLTMDVPNGTIVSGFNSSGTAVQGYLQQSYFVGATNLQIHYSTSDNQETYLTCQVGALPLTETAVTDGCFAETGVISIEGMSTDLEYAYILLTDNRNSRTIQSLSTEAEALYYECQTCPYADYQKNLDYYGANFDYSNQFINAALTSTMTNFEVGNVDFTDTSLRFRKEFISGATVMMSFFMKVVGDMEHAIDGCTEDCETDGSCNVDGSNSWDRAVAFYTGSLEGTMGTGSGLLLYTLADRRCINFKTCSAGNSGISNLNRNVFNLFDAGKLYLSNDACAEVRSNKDRIAQLMLVPLIQQTLHRAFLLDVEGLGGDAPNGQAMVASAAILPYLHACSVGDAATIYDNMASPIPDFATVKQTLERNYECLGIRCVDVGGLYSGPNEAYYDGAEPCQDDEETGSPSSAPPTTPEPTTLAPTPTPEPTVPTTPMPSISTAPTATSTSMPPTPSSTTTGSSADTISVCLAIVISSLVCAASL